MTQVLPFGDVLARRVSAIPGAPRVYSKVLSVVDKDLLAHWHRLPANKLQLRQIVILCVPRHGYDLAGVGFLSRILLQVMNLEQTIEDEEGILDLSAPVILHIARIDL